MKTSLELYARYSPALRIKVLPPHVLTPNLYSYYSTHHHPKLALEPVHSSIRQYFKFYDNVLHHTHISSILNWNFINQAGKDYLKPLAIVGPSGVGKSTLITKMIENFPSNFEFSISSTTRKPRNGETHGVEYYFLTKEEFMEQAKKGEFVEWAEVHGNFYGTSKKAIENIQKKGKICIMDIDVQGVKAISNSEIQINSIFVQPKSTEQLVQRLRSRGKDSEETIMRRAKNADAEMNFAQSNPHLFRKFLVNDDINIASEELEDCILQLYQHIDTQNLVLST